ncbi:MAG TPA: hypothetical protein VGR30_09545 [Candidatus Binatia bacterium]|jgi:hypothetical protein|nr:hypothetical protein [Candidatus Binatia bacterium]
MMYETSLSAEERLASLFQPDTLISEQYLDTFRRRSHLEPEKRLMLAVLEDAVACFQKYVSARDHRGKAMFLEAEEWILEKGSDWLLSFENICEVLGMNPHYVRQGLMRWKEMKLGQRPRAKVYRLNPRRTRKGGAGIPRRHGQRLLKVASR